MQTVQTNLRFKRSRCRKRSLSVENTFTRATAHLRRAAKNAALAGAAGFAAVTQAAAHPAVHPPSIERLAPVIWDAASEQRKTASAAT
jgi:hypothetical protein